MTRRAVVILAVFLLVAAFTAPPAAAAQLAPNTPIYRFDGPCTNIAQYGNVSPTVLDAHLTGDFSPCGSSQSYITLVFFDATYGLLNVVCQRGQGGAGLTGLGLCVWNNQSQTEAAWFQTSNSGQVAFGMKTEVAPIINGHVVYVTKSYSAFG